LYVMRRDAPALFLTSTGLHRCAQAGRNPHCAI
jgi:hypothetical protein